MATPFRYTTDRRRRRYTNGIRTVYLAIAGYTVFFLGRGAVEPIGQTLRSDRHVEKLSSGVRQAPDRVVDRDKVAVQCAEHSHGDALELSRRRFFDETA